MIAKSEKMSAFGRQNTVREIAYRRFVIGSEPSSPSPSPHAGEIEQFVVDQIRQIGQAPELIRETLIKTQEHQQQLTHSLQVELAAIHRQRRHDEAELQKGAGHTPRKRRMWLALDWPTCRTGYARRIDGWVERIH